MKSRYGQILDVFSPTELDFVIHHIALQIPQRNFERKDTYISGFTDQDPVYPAVKKFVIDRINATCPWPINKVAWGMHLVTRNPYSIHTDKWSGGDDGKGLAYVVPLWTVPRSPSANTKTIVFNEEFLDTDRFDDFVASQPEVKIPDAASVWHEVPGDIDRAQCKYLSVALAAEWHLGSVIYWHRTQLHCSDDFPKKGIEEKSALVIFSHHES